MPSARDYPYFADGFAALAHRGGRSPARPAAENSLAAFTAAVALGYRYLETDVQVSSDGVLFAFHDPTLERVTDGSGPPDALTWRDLSRLRLAGGEPIPLLDELFEALPEARFNIDLKVPAAAAPLAAAIQAHGAHDRVCVGSFSNASIRHFRRLAGPRVATAVEPAGVVAYSYTPLLTRMVRSPGAVLQLPTTVNNRTLVTGSLIRAAHAAGRHVHVWTINDPAEMERLIDLGVDGLVTDDIETLRDVLIRRNLWTRQP